MTDHPDTDLTDPDGEAEALRKENERLRAERDRWRNDCLDANNSEAQLRRRAEAAEAQRQAADDALVDKYRKPGSGLFKFPDDVAAIVMRLDAAEAEVARLLAAADGAAYEAAKLLTFAEDERDAAIARAEAAEAALAASRAPDPVAKADSCQSGDLISRAAVIAIAERAELDFADPSWTLEEIRALPAASVAEAATCLHLTADMAARCPTCNPGLSTALPDAGAEAQPVAWYLTNLQGRMNLATDYAVTAQAWRDKGYTVQPLYAHPPAQPAAPSDGTCKKCGCAPTNADGLCATCRDAQPTIGGEELDALVARLRSFDGDGHTRFAGKTICESAADAITALRAQPDWKAMAERLVVAMQKAEVFLDGEPEYHRQGMGCGLEDRNITDRYDAMEHGWDCAIDRVYGEHITWAKAVLAAALSDLAKMKGE